MISQLRPAETRFVARQPVFDRNRRVFGYELLFRSSKDALACDVGSKEASLSTIDISLFIGPGSLTEGRRAFVNCTRELLVDDLITALPRDLTVIEILETTEPDAEVIAACARLKSAGYSLALDDFDYSRDRSELVPFADIIKVDFQTTSPEEQREIAELYLPRGIAMLAEKVETQEEFELARECGYSYFQGYFFCRPVTIASADIPALQLNYFRILQAAFQSELDLFGLESAIKTEPALCYRLLRYLNSAAFGIYPVTSIRHALALLGSRDLRKWIAIMAAISIAGPNSAELVVTALARARFCEALAFPMHIVDGDLFLLGLLSLVDAMLNQPMERILAKLPVQGTLSDALLGKPSELLTILELVRICERGDWDALATASKRQVLDESQVWLCYTEALRWAREIHSQAEPGAK